MSVKLILASLFLVLLSLFGEQGAYRLYQLLQHKKTLERENAALQGKNEELVQAISKLQDPVALERFIREERGYIREGERLLEITPPPK
ncbi:MAG: septum formation initiator family protein [Deltaproteobacteria bacterium]|nr:septum formation initiator family protein [Deltaproteobacteria bacterium]MBI2501466.1 septum formation initiator family protein [Deltaproteobacteria bacterium]